MQEMGLKLEQLLPTNLTLFTADKKSLTVLGAVPVIISVQCEDGGTATTRDLLYIVEELSSVFISRDTLSNLGIIGKEFPKVHINNQHEPRLGGRGPGIQRRHRHRPALYQAE
jgi:hypothetical protein